jgi:pimeloyl-ACP methyl ester carboxylesterase
MASPARFSAPHLGLLLLEGPRAFFEASLLLPSAPLLARAPRGDGQPVLVLPGFAASDASTEVLRAYLRALGYRTHGWGLGRNVGPGDGLGRLLAGRLLALQRRYARRVSLVGWSLGGVYARELAKREPRSVRQVISLGSPFGGRVDPPPPIPSTAIWSRTDGIAPWRACVESEGAQAENIEVVASHCGLGFHPAVLYAIADRLAQPEGAWRPFDRSALPRAIYPRRE